MTATMNGLAAGLLWQMSTWATRAACLSTDAQEAGDWDASDYADQQADRLASFCLTCPVAGPCLELALVLDVDTGVRGGLTPAERVDYLGATGALTQEPELLADQP